MSRNHRNPNRWVQKKQDKKIRRQAWREHWEKTQNEAFTLEEVSWVVAGYESEGCVFEPDATHAIFQRLVDHVRGHWMSSSENKLQAVALVMQSAIYYPTKNIDRRAEFGMEVE